VSRTKYVQAQSVATRARAALDQPGVLQVDEESVDRGLVKTELVGELGDAVLRVLGAEGVQDRHGALDRLDPVAAPAVGPVIERLCRRLTQWDDVL
jgi:hypothetical protein